MKNIHLLLWAIISLTAGLTLPVMSEAACVVHNSDGTATVGHQDVLFIVVTDSPTCPKNVIDLKARLHESGLATQSAMVANRGRNNPALGSFSFFEFGEGSGKVTVQPGDFFFGHFTDADAGVVGLDQAPDKGKLMIEVIAWDTKKQLFNFYELIGQGRGSAWFYRGDSADILKDVQLLYRDRPTGVSPFGKTLRCSGCHISGGPIMKENSLPHNDWWSTSRPLPLNPNSASPEVSAMMNHLVDAHAFSGVVDVGDAHLKNSPTYRNLASHRTLQEQLRPLFCETEINLSSDNIGRDATDDTTDNSDGGSSARSQVQDQPVQIPSAFFLNPLLGHVDATISAIDYAQLLSDFNMTFPETHRHDADHAWLTPVKGSTDIKFVSGLMGGTITEKFAQDVLMVDFQHPTLSNTRCELLKLVPAQTSGDWQAIFIQNLLASTLPQAHELYLNLTDPTHTSELYHDKIAAYTSALKSAVTSSVGQAQIFKNLMDVRQAVFDGEISKNPRGQIFEPGFRVIFPVREAQP